MRIDMVYLLHFYALFWALLSACILGILSSRFTFIVPLVFYNLLFDESLWEYRFVVMTVWIPLVFPGIFTGHSPNPVSSFWMKVNK